jgi:hypothetical protein
VRSIANGKVMTVSAGNIFNLDGLDKENGNFKLNLMVKFKKTVRQGD